MMLNLKISIDDLQKILQCLFYIAIPIITLMTYLKAKRGLLSSVNTEYHKKVIERLDDLSKTLLDEYDWDSPNHWTKKYYAEDAIDIMNKTFLKYKKDILRTQKYQYGIPSNDDYHRLSNLVMRVKSDPFIPKVIRDKVTDLLEHRANIIINVHLQQLKTYGNNLAKGIDIEDLDENKAILHNLIMDELRKNGCGVEQIEEKVHEIRFEIQNYFEKFFPK